MADEFQDTNQRSQEDDPYKGLTPKKVLLNPKFHTYAPDVRRFMLSKIDPAFGGLDRADQDQALSLGVDYWNKYFAPAEEKGILEKAKDWLFPEQKPKPLEAPPQTGYGFPVPPPGMAPGSPAEARAKVTPPAALPPPPGAEPSVVKRTRVKLNPDKEKEFQNWYGRMAAIAKIDPDPDNPLHKYDYRAAFLAGEMPKFNPEDGQYHWPSAYKDPDHPNRFVNGIDTITGKPVSLQGPPPGFVKETPPPSWEAQHPIGAAALKVLEPIQKGREAYEKAIDTIVEKVIPSYDPNAPGVAERGGAKESWWGTFLRSMPPEMIKNAARFITDPVNIAFAAAGVPPTGAKLAIMGARPALRYAADAVFTVANGMGALESIERGEYANAAVQGTFAVLGMLNVPVKIRARILENIRRDTDRRFRYAKNVSPGAAYAAEPGAPAATQYRDIVEIQKQLTGKTTGLLAPEAEKPEVIARRQAPLGLPPAPGVTLPGGEPVVSRQADIIPGQPGGLEPFRRIEKTLIGPEEGVKPGPVPESNRPMSAQDYLRMEERMGMIEDGILKQPGINIEQVREEFRLARQREDFAALRRLRAKLGVAMPGEEEGLPGKRPGLEAPPEPAEARLQREVQELGASLPAEAPKPETLKGPFMVGPAVTPGEGLPKPKSLARQKSAQEKFLGALGYTPENPILEPLVGIIPHRVIGEGAGTWPEGGGLITELNYRVLLTDPNATAADAELLAAFLGNPHQTAVPIVYHDAGAETHVGIKITNPDGSEFTQGQIKKIGEGAKVGFETNPGNTEIRFTLWNSAGAEGFVRDTIAAIQSAGLSIDNAVGFKGGSYLVFNKDFNGIIERARNQRRSAERPDIPGEVLGRFTRAFESAYPEAARIIRKRRTAADAARQLDLFDLERTSRPIQVDKLVSGYGGGAPGAAAIGEGARGGLVSPPRWRGLEEPVRGGAIGSPKPVEPSTFFGRGISVEDAVLKMTGPSAPLRSPGQTQTIAGVNYVAKLAQSPRVKIQGKTLRVFDPEGFYSSDYPDYLRMHAADPAIRNIMGLQSNLADEWKTYLTDADPTTDFSRAQYDGEHTDWERLASNGYGVQIFGKGGPDPIHTNSMMQLNQTFAMVRNDWITKDELPQFHAALMVECLGHEFMHEKYRFDDARYEELLATHRWRNREFIKKTVEKYAEILSANDSKIIRDLGPSFGRYADRTVAIVESKGRTGDPGKAVDTFTKTAIEVLARSNKPSLPPPPGGGKIVAPTIKEVMATNESKGALTIEDLERTSAMADLVSGLLGREGVSSEPRARAAFAAHYGSQQYGNVTQSEFRQVYKAASIKANRSLSGLLPEEQESLTPGDLVRIYEFGEKLDPMIKDFEALSKMGKITRGWYQRAKKTTTWLSYHLPGPPRMSPETKRITFVKLLAALSPQQGVKDNFLQALKMWRFWADPQSAVEEFPDLKLHPDIVPFDRNVEHLKTLVTESIPEWEILPNGNRRYKYERDRRGRVIYDIDSETGERVPKRVYVTKGTVDLPGRINNTITAFSGLGKFVEGENEVWKPVGKLDLSGLKVTSFTRNIAGFLEYVTLDTHMANMADIPARKLGKKGAYLALSNALRQAAANIGYLPAEAQETAWYPLRALFLLNEKGVPFLEGLKKITPDLLMEYSANTELATMLLEDEDVANEIEALGIAGAVRKAHRTLQETTELGRDISDAEKIDPGIFESIAERSERVGARRASEAAAERERRGIEEPPTSAQLELFGAPAPKRGTEFEFGTNEPEPPIESPARATSGLEPPPESFREPEKVGRKKLPEKLSASDLGTPTKSFDNVETAWITPDGTFVKVDQFHYTSLAYATGLTKAQAIPRQKTLSAKYGLVRVRISGQPFSPRPGVEIYGVPTESQMKTIGRMQKELGVNILYDITDAEQNQVFTSGSGIGNLRRAIDEQFADPSLGMAAPQGFGNLPPAPGHDIIDEFMKATGRSGKTLGEAFRGMFTGERDVKIAETNQLRDKIEKIIPNVEDQEALTLYREFHNLPDEELIQLVDGTHPDYKEYADYLADEKKLGPQEVAAKVQQAIDRVKKLAPLIQKAMNPTPEMLQASALQTQYFREKLDEGRQNGFLKSSITPEEYVTHILISDYPPDRGDGVATNAPGGTMPKSFAFAKKRTFGNIVKAIIFDKKPATLNAVDAMTVYGNAHGSVLATRQFIETLQRNDVLRWGSRRSENIPQDWIPYTKGRNRLWEFPVEILDVNGRRVNADFVAYGPRKIVEALYPVTDPNFFDSVKGLQRMRMYQAYIKAVELSLSVFHVKALVLSAVKNMGPVETVKAYRMSLEAPEFKEAELRAIKHNMTSPILGRNIEARKRMYSSLDDPDFLEKISHLPVIEQTRWVARWITFQTFDIFQRKLKVGDFVAKEAAWIAKHLDATDAELTAARRSIAKEVNGIYGGLNWEVMGWSKSAVNIFRALLLAPDWTYSNILTAGYAFENSPAGRHSRIFWVASAAVGCALTQAMSLLLTGQPSKNPTKVYYGKDENGKEIYSNIFFAGGPNDVVNLINNVAEYGLVQGIAQSAGAKAAPLVRYAVQALTNRDWQGKAIVPRGAGPVAGTVRSLWHALKTIGPVPFSISTPLQMYYDGEPQNPAEYFSAIAFAARVTHKVPEGMREIGSGTRKGELAPKPERAKTGLWERITGTRMEVPTVLQFSKLSLDSAVSAYEAADDATREQYKPFLVRKMQSLYKYNIKNRKELMDKLEGFGLLKKPSRLPEPPPEPEGLLPPP